MNARSELRVIVCPQLSSVSSTAWDALLEPSVAHGVTTCVMGNCGVGFAPVRPSDHDKLIALMEGVEAGRRMPDQRSCRFQLTGFTAQAVGLDEHLGR